MVSHYKCNYDEPVRTIATSSQKRNLKEKLPYESDGRIERQNYTYESDGTDTKAK